MPPLIDMLLPQFDRELETTRRLLDVVPAADLAWGPGGKARTAAELMTHLVEIPAWTCGIMDEDGWDLADLPDPRRRYVGRSGAGAVRRRRRRRAPRPSPGARTAI